MTAAQTATQKRETKIKNQEIIKCKACFYLSVSDEFSQRVVDDFVARRYQIREGVTCHEDKKGNEYIQINDGRWRASGAITRKPHNTIISKIRLDDGAPIVCQCIEYDQKASAHIPKAAVTSSSAVERSARFSSQMTQQSASGNGVN